MSTLTFSALRQRVAAGLEALSGWNESPFAPDLFPRDTSKLGHRAFVVGVEQTSTHPQPNRRRASSTLLVSSTVLVRFAARLTANNQVAAYDAALDLEDAARSAVLGVASTDLHLLFRDSRREADPAGWVLVEIRFDAVHQI